MASPLIHPGTALALGGSMQTAIRAALETAERLLSEAGS
jgi:hypothetical protein